MVRRRALRERLLHWQKRMKISIASPGIVDIKREILRAVHVGACYANEKPLTGVQDPARDEDCLHIVHGVVQEGLPTQSVSVGKSVINSRDHFVKVVAMPGNVEPDRLDGQVKVVDERYLTDEVREGRGRIAPDKHNGGGQVGVVVGGLNEPLATSDQSTAGIFVNIDTGYRWVRSPVQVHSAPAEPVARPMVASVGRPEIGSRGDQGRLDEAGGWIGPPVEKPRPEMSGRPGDHRSSEAGA